MLSAIHAQIIVPLSDEKWTISSPALNQTVPGYLPSHVHLDLLKAGVIGGYYRLNEFEQRWVGDSNWTYTSGPIDGLNEGAESTWLVFDGLDTYTTVLLCGKQVASTDNQFRQYYFDVSDILRNCTDTPVLSLNFGSAPAIVDKIAEGYDWIELPLSFNFELPNRWYMRKEQSDFGWDWGPGFAPAGPWKPAYLVQFNSPERIYVLNTDLDICRKGQINHMPPDQNQPWVVNASIDFLGSIPPGPSMSIEITEAETGLVLTSEALCNVTVSEGSITGVTVLDGVQPKLWWPHGLGSQPLYQLSITIYGGKQSQSIACITKRVGFRTIFLNQRSITEDQISQGIAPGGNWHFEVNGHEFYVKGSNLIPPDAFWPRVTEDKMARLFDAAIEANQNMLRIWSSGSYLPDFMYDLADERGLLLWSEFQFSDAVYPVHQEFLDNVAGEVAYNVRRVNHHPSLALWSGGNEIEGFILLLVNFTNPKEHPRYVGEYEALYINLIMPLVYENSRSISYIPSSATNGYLDIDLSASIPMVERYNNTTFGHYYGDTEYYSYDSRIAFNFSAYPVGRFAVEFGHHSMPSLQTWKQALDPSDLHFNSSVVMLRNHHYPPSDRNTSNFRNSSIGMGELTMAVERYYPVPNKRDPVANFSAWCHATQLFQADMDKSQIQFYRRGSGMPERQLGTLYWQLEDIWQAPTWAGIEYDGRWKVLHYVARDIYKPIIVSPFWNTTSGALDIYVISDLWEPVTGTVRLTWLNLRGNGIPQNAGSPTSIPFNVGSLNATRIYSTDISSLNLADPQDSILLISLESNGHLPNMKESSSLTHENHFTPVIPKDLKLVDPGLELSHDAVSGTFTVQATSGVSLYTWLDYPAGLVGYFTENAFVLAPGQKKEIEFVVQVESGSDDWRDDVTVQSLWNQTLQD
ncbi:putative beta-mannosidase [Aspergillus steynii IBT 23096]|uniref:Beta-mannosidase A n=1 Tax=Aspergillus steynii IBT 23096 TaxID=1392250 RepID=A0A2I2GR45_9EURO|nr:putative beta-mannosidase [Aspergillus steynii IBT 23096]PLB55349.1 putative beta-mannosidase [Aspergillus steynii IBT 23096]